LIPPILINNKFVTTFTDKANFFNEFFSNQCTPLENGSSLPTTQNYLTTKTFDNIDFTDHDILDIIRSLDANKAHSHDDISVRMIKLSDYSIVKPLSIIFRNSLDSCVFPKEWKKI